MANEEQTGEIVSEIPKRSILPKVMVGVVIVVALTAIFTVMMMRSEPKIVAEQPPAEYIVQDKMFQLKDGSYLKLSFSIVVAAKNLEAVKNIIEKEAPGRLPDGINMVLGDKTRDDLISGTHKRESFARELKKVLEERVFADYNRRQMSAKDTIQVKEVLIADFVTQSG